MKLWEVLVKENSKAFNAAYEGVNVDKKFYENLGRISMLNDIYRMLSDETLNMGIKLRSEVLEKGEKDES